MLDAVLISLLQVSATLLADSPVTFAQEETRSSITLSATGEISSSEDGQVVALRDFEVTDQPINPSSYIYNSYRVCLAHKQQDAGWQMASCSNPVKIQVAITEGSKSLPERRLTIPSVSSEDGQGLWLVLEMNSRPVGGKSHSVIANSQQLPAGLQTASSP